MNPVTVEAPARLHLGFLDPGASRGRRYGSIGLAIDGLATVVEVARAGRPAPTTPDSARARALGASVRAHYGLADDFELSVTREIPPHAGLGSGTQLALAIGTALTRASGRTVSVQELAEVLGRGRRSGIGIHVFEHGGLIVDGGRGRLTRTPPLLSRCEFPSAWRAVLVFDREQRGLSGTDERAAFEYLPALPAAVAAHLCHLTLMQLVPGVIEADFDAFATALAELQAEIGAYFAAVQTGHYSSVHVAEAMRFLAGQAGLGGCGQSSWGPTAFAFAPSVSLAETALAAARSRFAHLPQLDFSVHAACNHGAQIAPGRNTARRATG